MVCVSESLVEVVAGAYVFPPVLTPAEIEKILRLPVTPLSCGPGSMDEDGGESQEEYEERRRREDERWERMRKKREKEEREKGKEQNPAKPEKEKKPESSLPDKPLVLPWVAKLLWPPVAEIQIGKSRAYRVDERMKLYRLPPGVSVFPHFDSDFAGPDQSIALCSILVYLNDDYVGGETVFNRLGTAGRIASGGGLVFRHDIIHEGLPVVSGVKWVLKTDLLFRAH